MSIRSLFAFIKIKITYVQNYVYKSNSNVNTVTLCNSNSCCLTKPF